MMIPNSYSQWIDMQNKYMESREKTMLMHTLKKRLKEIDEHYEIVEENDDYWIAYKGKYDNQQLVSFNKRKVKFHAPYMDNLIKGSFFSPETLPDLWKIIKLVSEYLN